MQSTTPSNSQRKTPKGALASLAVVVLLAIVTLVVILNRQFIVDSVHYWTYEPTADIQSITTRSAFTDNGKFMFYITRPEVQEAAEFNSNCDRKEQGTAILGCYANDRIYLFNVTDERLDGIKEVTAAHEMLHAAYQRLSGDEKRRIDTLIDIEYEAMKSNPDLAERMAFYARTEPGERLNELHSIIGTEMATISPELEKHYAKYMSNRAGIVSLYSGYNTLFLQLDQYAKELSANLDKLAKQIETDTNKYNADIKVLNADISDFNSRASSGDFPSQSAFYRERTALQQRSSAVGKLRDTINANVAQYEKLRIEYNNTVTESHTLYDSIDSTLEPAPSV